MVKYKASDLYLSVGFPPTLRRDGHESEEGTETLINLRSHPLSVDDVKEMINVLLTVKQKRDFDQTNELNMALDMGEYGRFRVNVFKQRQNPGLVIRLIQQKIPSFEDLRLPSVLEALSLQQRGLILITGMAGSGKSTTASAMVDYRNNNMQGHIVTIEDPIEFYHEHKKSLVTQREIGADTQSFQVAIKNALRQRPDLIFVGETRERAVMDQALAASETGHLCLTTLHASNAYQAIERVVNMFSEEYHNQIRLNLSTNLKAIIAQRLIPSIQGGVVPAVEVLLNQGLVSKLILTGEITQIKDVMEQTTAQGMATFDFSILQLYMHGLITEDTALAYADKPSDLKIKIKQYDLGNKSVGSKKHLSGVDTSKIFLND